MTKNKLNSKFIKYQLMKYFRFDRGYTFCVSECINKSDINALNDNSLVEVEIKISKQDFLKEFDGKSKIKTYKHKCLNGYKSKKKGYITPNYYYFCVPRELCNFVLDYLNTHYPKYGLLVCEEYRIYGQRSNITCIKRPKRIHDIQPSKTIFTKIGKRLQSELINLYKKYFEKT